VQPYVPLPTSPPFLSIKRGPSENSCRFLQRRSQNVRPRVHVRVSKRTTILRTFTIGEVQSSSLVSWSPSFVAWCNLHTLAVIITDHEYPVRPAFSLLSKLLDDFTAKVPQSSFSNPSAISFPDINTYIQKYQDPRHADNIMRVQQELDETKIVLVRNTFSKSSPLIHTSRSQHKTIESVLQRGEKLDNLVERSTALSAQSKMFYKTAKKASPSCPFSFLNLVD
jgi:hypothetical protein